MLLENLTNFHIFGDYNCTDDSEHCIYCLRLKCPNVFLIPLCKYLKIIRNLACSKVFKFWYSCQHSFQNLCHSFLISKKMLSLSIKGKELKVISRKFVSVTLDVQYITNSIKSIPRYMWNQSFFSTSMLIYCHIFFSSPNHLLCRPLWSQSKWLWVILFW